MKLIEINRMNFLSLEDEIDLRLRFKQIVKSGGIVELVQAAGEIGASYIIALEILEEALTTNSKK